MQMALDMESKYTTKQLFDVLELLDVHDALLEEAKIKAKQQKPK